MTEDTRTVILRQAEFLIRTRGYAAFSYADLAQTAGITKASVHYHFPTKEDLVTVLVQQYLERFVATLDGDPTAPRRAGSPACATMPCCSSTGSSRACCRCAAPFPPSAWPCPPACTAPSTSSSGSISSGSRACSRRGWRRANCAPARRRPRGAAPAQHARGRHLRRLGAAGERHRAGRVRGGDARSRALTPSARRSSRA